ncbi:MAG: GGDEF domain-containing protein [Mesorhizobium sp.]|nr:GGDEF domain-containing protein [Mesorhizobium sp.]MCO5162438.1 GGDEF domain-containing protein [Mesorhizobium sp.]
MPLRGLSGISRRGWIRLARWTVFGTLGCIAIAVAFNYVFFSLLAPSALVPSLVSATVIPIILAGPLFFFLTAKLRELAIANHKLNDLASTDSLTGCLNRGAFTRVVDGFLEESGGAGPPVGALLVIDADHFKAINDRFGHHRGDEALNLIATAIRTSLRRGDLIGRIGGEEFGVLLPGAGLVEAEDIAERIRHTVSSLEFNGNSQRHDLTVSVGGAAFGRPVNFSELFRIADERLYVAKNTGRDRVEITYVPPAGFAVENTLTVH